MTKLLFQCMTSWRQLWHWERDQRQQNTIFKCCESLCLASTNIVACFHDWSFNLPMTSCRQLHLTFKNYKHTHTHTATHIWNTKQNGKLSHESELNQPNEQLVHLHRGWSREGAFHSNWNNCTVHTDTHTHKHFHAETVNAHTHTVSQQKHLK